MGKNATGGKHRKKGKNHNSSFDKRELRFKEELQEYALVEKNLGDCRVDCRCQDGEQRICHIRGKMRKRVWISAGDVLLIGIREFQQDKADVIHKYTPSEVLSLVQYKEITFPSLISALHSDADVEEVSFLSSSSLNHDGGDSMPTEEASSGTVGTTSLETITEETLNIDLI